jgi:hypothetical protein
MMAQCNPASDGPALGRHDRSEVVTPDALRRIPGRKRVRVRGVTLLAAGAATALLISFLWSPAALPRFTICPTKQFLGIPCPGCGLTHSFCAISHGQFADAVRYNPFGYLFYALALTLVAGPAPCRFFPSLPDRLRARWLLLVPALVAAMYAVWAARLVRDGP